MEDTSEGKQNFQISNVVKDYTIQNGFAFPGLRNKGQWLH